jgi:tRNA threonylcarbamoyladenosine biosynthesis protein TsaB
MYLFLNTLAPVSVAFIFEDGRILHRVEWDSKLREYDTLLPKLDELFAMAGISAADLAGIVCVNGPGSFTGTRTVVLTVNALAYAHGLPVMPMDLFELGDLFGWPYPRIVSVNGRET